MDNHEVLTIRAPRSGDGADLARGWLDAGIYYNELAPEFFQVPNEDGLIEWFEDELLKTSPEELNLVAEYAGHAVGLVYAAIESPLPTAAWQLVRDLAYSRLNIQALVVQRAYWRHGIGKQLLTAAEEWGRSKGASVALLDTFIGSPISIPFYEQRMAYQRRSIHYYKPLVE